MKRPIAYFLILLAAASIYTSCNNGSRINKLLQESNLDLQTFSIDITRDTVLKTKNHALISIPKGSLQTVTGNTANIQIREAYTIQQMITAGLVTTTDGQPLSSGGMILIQAAGGSDITIKSGISVSIPTSFIRPGMQVYKGDKSKDGSINWKDPKPLDTVTKQEDNILGKTLYNTNCATCHSLTKDATGPKLAHITSRRSKEWLYNFTSNPPGLIASGDPYANALFCKWKPTVMTAFPMSHEEMDRLYNYIAEISKNIDPATIPDDKASFDSCMQRKNEMQQTKNLAAKRQALIDNNGNRIIKIDDSTRTAGAISNIPDIDDNLVTSTNYPAVFYQFTIHEFGWYNIDILLDNIPGVQDSKLMVRIQGSYNREVNVYLIIPNYKIFTPGGLVEDKDDVYAFYKRNGGILLPQGTKAYIIAMQEDSGSIFFAKTAFTTATSQQLNLTLRKTTQADMNNAIAALSLNDLSITASASKNADSIRATDKALLEVQSLMPKNIDCNCSTGYPTSDSLVDEQPMK